MRHRLNGNVHSFAMNTGENVNINYIPKEIFSILPNLHELEVVSPNFNAFSSEDFLNANKLYKLNVEQSTHLTKLSTGSFPPINLKELKLDNNAFETIDDFAFSNLTKLQNLYLVKNNLATINRNTFAGLSELLILNLGENGIHSIEIGAFADLKKLKTLDIHKNKLKVLNDHLLDGMSQINTLILGGNELNRINDGNSLYTLTGLQVLYLDNNSISDLDLVKLTRLPSLRKLILNHNKINLENYIIESEEPSQSPVVWLNLGFNRLTTVESLEILRLFPKLLRLEIQGNSKELCESDIKPKNLAFLPKLNILNSRDARGCS